MSPALFTATAGEDESSSGSESAFTADQPPFGSRVAVSMTQCPPVRRLQTATVFPDAFIATACAMPSALLPEIGATCRPGAGRLGSDAKTAYSPETLTLQTTTACPPSFTATAGYPPFGSRPESVVGSSHAAAEADARISAVKAQREATARFRSNRVTDGL